MNNAHPDSATPEHHPVFPQTTPTSLKSLTDPIDVVSLRLSQYTDAYILRTTVISHHCATVQALRHASTDYGMVSCSIDRTDDHLNSTYTCTAAYDEPRYFPQKQHTNAYMRCYDSPCYCYKVVDEQGLASHRHGRSDFNLQYVY